MPVQFLSQVERERLQSFPSEITFNELITFFTLSQKDLNLTKKRSGDHNLLGFALQLGTLKFLGFIPDNFPHLPSDVIEYVAQQLNVSVSVLSLYGERSQTRTNQLQEIQDYLGWSKPTATDYQKLAAWLLQRAMEHDRPLLLLQLLIKKLETSKIIRPGLTVLERMVATARNEAWVETYNYLEPILSEERSLFLNKLLELDSESGRIPLSWLRTGAVSNSPKAILNALAKLAFLNQYHVTEWDVSVLNPNRLKFLAKLGRKSTPQALRYSYIRQFAPSFLISFNFHSNHRLDGLLEAISLLRNLDVTKKRKIPETTSINFVPAKWQDYVVNEEGQILRKYYELCALWQLRAALRSGNVWLNHSRKYANPESYLIPTEQWASLKSEVCQLVQISESGIHTVEAKIKELEKLLLEFDASFLDNEQVRIEKDKLVITPLSAESVSPSTKQLRQQIRERLPWIELTELLIEIDNLTGFSQALISAADSATRTPELQKHLYAAIIAQACNIGLERMARLANLSYLQLAWCNNWYLREFTLKAANNQIVNFQYHLTLSQIWGGGTLSSSDGQRFPVSVKNRMAVSLPRYFGYGQGVSFYSWTSDQFSQYGCKPTISTLRDSTYVLDEILDNETELPIMEHTTDTAGYTELVFAMFDLLGLQFSPRIKDLGSQRLYRANRGQEYQHIDSLLSGTIKTDKILARWDDMLRVAGSLKLGWVTASLFLNKLKSLTQQNNLASSFAEYGRMIKTIFILRYLMNQPYRRKINNQLNKGERLHDLRRFLFFAHQGTIRQRYEDDLSNQASCLNLVTNAVVTWNTLYMEAAIKQLRSEGYQISDEDISHLSPTRYRHINPYGKYQFDIETESKRTQLRPLRKP